MARLDRIRDAIPEFARTVRYGRTLADADVVDRLRQSAMGFFQEVVKRPVGAKKKPVRSIRYRPPNRAALNFWRANRPGESCDDVEIEAEPRDDTPSRLADSAFKRFMAGFTTARGPTSDE